MYRVKAQCCPSSVEGTIYCVPQYVLGSKKLAKLVEFTVDKKPKKIPQKFPKLVKFRIEKKTQKFSQKFPKFSSIFGPKNHKILWGKKMALIGSTITENLGLKTHTHTHIRCITHYTLETQIHCPWLSLLLWLCCTNCCWPLGGGGT